MTSPFPGMDPSLEARWSEMHSRLNIYASDVLNQRLPPGLLARSEERAIVSTGEVLLDLQPMIDKIDNDSRYAEDIDYSEPLHPPLSPKETEWAAKLISAHPAV